MSFLSEYNEISGVVYETEEEKFNKWLEANGLKPGAAAGGLMGNLLQGKASNAPAGGGDKGPAQNPPSPPPGPPPLPPNFVPSPTAGRGLSRDGNNAVRLDPSTNSWVLDTSGYRPSAAELQAAGITRGAGGSSSGGTRSGGGTPRTGGGGGSAPRNFAEENAANKRDQLLAGGGTLEPPRGWQVSPTRAVDASGLTVWTKDTQTGVWTNAGFPPNAADKAAAARLSLTERTAPATATTTPQQTLTLPGAPPPPARDNLMAAGVPGTRTTALPNAVNNMTVQNPHQGFSGFINRGEGQRAPASMGVGPGVSSNMITFSPNERGFTQAADRISGTYTVPDWLSYEGRNAEGFGVPTPIGVHLGPPAANPVTAMANTVPLQMAGNNVTFSAPDRSWGTGFVLNALPHSNIAMAQGRDIGNLPPQAQAAATWALLDQQMGGAMSGAYRTEEGAHIFGGREDLDGNWATPFAGGGRVATGPLGKPDLITNEPIVGVGLVTGKKHFLLGEDNADADVRPDPEAVYIRKGVMDIVPLDPPAGLMPFAQGGRVAFQPQGYDDSLPQPAGFTWGGYTFRPPQLMFPQVVPLPPVGRNAAWFPGFSGGGTVATTTSSTPSTPSTTPSLNIEGFDPLAPSILAPWQQEQTRNLQRQAQRDRMGYRFKTAGISGPTGLDVIEGNAPATELPPGFYYDTTKQVNNRIADLTGKQDELKALGGLENEELLNQEMLGLWTNLDKFKHIRDLQLGLTAAQVGLGNVAALEQQYLDLGSLIASILHNPGGQGLNPHDPFAIGAAVEALKLQQSNILGQIKDAQNAAQQVARINAQIAQLTTETEGMSEAGLETQLNLKKQGLQRNVRRRNLASEVKNLAALGVPNLSQPVAA